jgi:phosphoglycolate phosphatase-like HAD superfamily hydrolase
MALPRMRILSDFDGVFTDPADEAAAVGERMAERLSAITGVGEARVILDAVRASIEAEPTAHGWRIGEAISCYADEDPYARHNATAAALYAGADPALRRRLAAAGFPDHETFSVACFEEGTARWRAKGASHLARDVAAAVAALVGGGAELVIVSNSLPDRVNGILRDGGIDPDRMAGLRVRGGAKKFVVDPSLDALPQTEMFGDRRVALRRPHYLAVLEEERPDVLIGDVLSLDLSLPAFLRGEVAGGRPKLFLRQNDYTPRWSLDACAGRKIDVVGGLGEMAERLGI